MIKFRKDLLPNSRIASKEIFEYLPNDFYMIDSIKLDVNYDADGYITDFYYKDYLNDIIYVHPKFVVKYHTYNKESSLDKYDSFYLYKDNIVTVITENDTSAFKEVFTKDGMLIDKVHDTVDGTTVLKSNNFTRRIKNISVVFSDGIPKVYIYNLSNISVIKDKKRDKKIVNIHNPNIGTLDLETFVNKYGIPVVYAAGFYVSGMGDESFKRYINTTTLDSDEVVLYCINAMMNPKYNKFVYYVHNLAKYDVTFIIKTLVDFNLKIGY